MWRKRSAAVAVLAALLTVVMGATPALAAGDPPKPFNGDPRYKYGVDYFQKEWTSETGYKKSTWTSIQQQLNNTLNPQGTSSTRPLNTSNTPLSGKIIEPAKTPAKPPAVYTRYPGLTGVGGALGISRIIGTAGIGIGGVSQAPANSGAIALSQGVSQGCIDGTGTCTTEEIRKQFVINSCQHTDSCSTLGATNADGSPMLNMFESLIPLAADLWSAITGQGGDKQEPINGHYNVTSMGCKVRIDFEKRDGANGTLHVNQTELRGRPASGIIGQNAWDQACASNVANTMTGLNTAAADRIITECVNPATGLTSTTGSNPNPYGIDLGINTATGGTFRSDGTNQSSLCDNATYVLMKVKIYNNQPQTYFGTLTNSNAVAVEYTEWVNPDPSLDVIEDLEIKTNWTCRDSAGTEHNLSRTVTKVGGFVEPSCPPGSDLVKHEVTAGNFAGPKTVLDGGNENPAAKAQYPDCTGASCALSITVDGQTCTAAISVCQSWPQVHAANPYRVQCNWGGYVLPTDNCLTLSNAYKSDFGVVFDPKSQTWIAPDVYGNPVAPNPEPWNPTNPNPTPGTNPVTGTPTVPGTGTPGFPGTGVTPGGSTTNTNCADRPWSWNPTEWVETPVVCALVYAFVPKTDVAAQIGQLQTLTLDRPPLNWINPVVAGPGGGGCPNWNIVLPGVSQNVVCESSFTGAIVGARGALFGLVATAMVWPLMRSIWYAAIPILRVSPGSSK